MRHVKRRRVDQRPPHADVPPDRRLCDRLADRSRRCRLQRLLVLLSFRGPGPAHAFACAPALTSDRCASRSPSAPLEDPESHRDHKAAQARSARAKQPLLRTRLREPRRRLAPSASSLSLWARLVAAARRRHRFAPAGADNKDSYCASIPRSAFACARVNSSELTPNTTREGPRRAGVRVICLPGAGRYLVAG